MKAAELRKNYIEFFVKNAGHTAIPGASLLPENDPTVLFTTAGMQPLVPYFLGEKHPAGTRLVNVQKCLRTDDIEEVGDDTHLTFFEMLGNWSLGDYFNIESIKWSYEFLVTPVTEGGLGIDVNLLAVSVFEGDDNAPRDEASADLWRELGIAEERIAYLDKEENWWPAGGKMPGPQGPDTEIFYWQGDEPVPEKFDPENENWVEIWNNVFMKYNKTPEGKYEALAQKNVDTGMGLERMVAILQGKKNMFETDLFSDVIADLKENSTTYDERNARVISDHLRSSVFILGDARGVNPGNTDQSYILRRLIRRAIRSGRKLGLPSPFTNKIADIFINKYSDAYPELIQKREHILNELRQEEEQFAVTLEKGEKEFDRMLKGLIDGSTFPGKLAFKLYDTFGFPIEMTTELAGEHDLEVDRPGFDAAFKDHQDLSRKGAENKFKGGLADDSEETTRLHTATHLLHQALRKVLGDHVQQKGSNITKERLRFDFNHDSSMTPDEIEQVEKIVNTQIERALPIGFEEMGVDEAKTQGAIGLFEDRYAQMDNKIKVYRIGDFSLEICGGPHVENTKEIGHFRIKREQSSSRGVRRIKAVIE